jgi:hypothetical protein
MALVLDLEAGVGEIKTAQLKLSDLFERQAEALDLARTYHVDKPLPPAIFFARTSRDRLDAESHDAIVALAASARDCLKTVKLAQDHLHSAAIRDMVHIMADFGSEPHTPALQTHVAQLISAIPVLDHIPPQLDAAFTNAVADLNGKLVAKIDTDRAQVERLLYEQEQRARLLFSAASFQANEWPEEGRRGAVRLLEAAFRLHEGVTEYLRPVGASPRAN